MENLISIKGTRMSSSVIFDTLEYVESLKKSGIKQEQAEAITRATSKAFIQLIEASDLATKNDLVSLKIELQSFIIKAVSTTILLLGGWQTLFNYFK